MNREADLAERKARLVAQSDLQRMQAMLAWHTIRRAVSPPPPSERSPASRSVATTIIGLALPLFGAGRLPGRLSHAVDRRDGAAHLSRLARPLGVFQPLMA